MNGYWCSKLTPVGGVSAARISLTLASAFVAAVATFGVLFAAESSSDTASIETPFFRFSLSRTDGRCEIYDKQARVTWQADRPEHRFGQLRFSSHEQTHGGDLTRCQASVEGTELRAVFRPLPATPWVGLLVRARALDPKTLELSYQEDDELQVESVVLLEDVLGVPAGTKGYVTVPIREGLLVPADSGLSFTRSFDTYAYEGCHMAMLGVVKSGAAALVTWDDPYISVELRSRFLNAKANQRLSPDLVLTGPARSFRIQFLGKGDYVTIAKAYREVAREKGWLVTWDEKLKANPERAKLFGAVNFKLWSALDRRMNVESTQELSVHTNWTFA